MFSLSCNVEELLQESWEFLLYVFIQLLAKPMKFFSRTIYHSFAAKPAKIHTSSIYAPHSPDGFVVVHLAVSAISGSRRVPGFHGDSLEITQFPFLPFSPHPIYGLSVASTPSPLCLISVAKYCERNEQPGRD